MATASFPAKYLVFDLSDLIALKITSATFLGEEELGMVFYKVSQSQNCFVMLLNRAYINK